MIPHGWGVTQKKWSQVLGKDYRYEARFGQCTMDDEQNDNSPFIV